MDNTKDASRSTPNEVTLQSTNKKQYNFGSSDAWTAIATIGLIIVGIWGVTETKNALKLSERAWVIPAGMSLSAPIEVDKPIRFNLVLYNSGKEPAQGAAYATQNGTVKAPPQDDWTSLVVEKNSSCEGLVPKNGAQAITPSLNGLANTRAFDGETGTGQVVASKSILDGSIYYYIRGCVAYETFQEPHISSFCYVLQTRPGVAWHQLLFIACPTGFDVN